MDKIYLPNTTTQDYLQSDNGELPTGKERLSQTETRRKMKRDLKFTAVLIQILSNGWKIKGHVYLDLPQEEQNMTISSLFSVQLLFKDSLRLKLWFFFSIK